ncbi:MAG TPA: hypothetical protein VK525_12345 [Candidatus Saccharimonadales bacterium]|nr:hypothetical protein [Candidatus Saccharimonadales bacterium]
MAIERQQFIGTRKPAAVAIIVTLLLTCSGASLLHGQHAPAKTEKKTMTTTGKFYCNTKALNPAERTRHKELTERLIAARRGIAETEKGYEFQYSPTKISFAELADWVVWPKASVVRFLISILIGKEKGNCSAFV